MDRVPDDRFSNQQRRDGSLGRELVREFGTSSACESDVHLSRIQSIASFLSL